MDSVQDRTQVLLDRQAVLDCWAHYCRLLDAKETDRVATETFAADAVLVQAFNSGAEPDVIRGRDALRAMYVESFGMWEWTAHVMSATGHVAVDGDRATGWVYISAWHWLRGDAPREPGRPADWMCVGLVEDELRREPAGWRVAHRRLSPVGGVVTVGKFPPFMAALDQFQASPR